MTNHPRLVDIFGPDKPPARMSRRRRALVTQDGTLIVRHESYPIAGEPLALDSRPTPSLRSVTFDGAAPTPTTKELR